MTTDELDGLPKDVLAATAAAAQGAGAATGLHRLSLKMPVYLPVMQFAKSSALREQLYKAYVTRASDQAAAGQAALDNTPVMQSILALRAEEAQLLGYPHFAALSLAPKMAESSTQVMTFLRDLAQRARPYAERDLADMREFAQKELGIADPQAWDWPFIG